MVAAKVAVEPRPSVAPEPHAVVHLIGWTGCQPKHLQKYVDVWTGLGGAAVMETSHCRMGVSEAWSTTKFEALAAELLERLESAGTAKLVLHIFSNGGGMLWAALTRRMEATASRVRFAALVFDSCPGSFRSLTAGFNFLWASQRAPAARVGIAVAAPLIALVACVSTLASVRCSTSGASDAQSRYIDDFVRYCERLHEPSPRLPVLFLYSADDALIPPSAVEGAMQRLTAAGADVAHKRWERSEHVQHLRTDPEGYRAELVGTLSRL